MKLRKILATVAASALALSAMSVTSFADDITEGTIDLFQVCTYYQDSTAWTWNASDPVTFGADGKAKVEWDLSTLTSADDSVPGKIGYQMVYKGNDNDFEISFKCTSAQIVGAATVDVAGLVGEQTQTVTGQWKTANTEILLTDAPIAATTADIKKLGKLVVEVELTKTPYDTTFAASADDAAAEAIAMTAANSPYAFAKDVVAETAISAINAEIELAAGENVSWNAWCNSSIIVTVNGTPNYFVFAGDQVTWDVTFNEGAENEFKVTPADFAATGNEGTITVNMPVAIAAGDTYSIDIVCQAWADDTTGETVFTVKNVTYDAAAADVDADADDAEIEDDEEVVAEPDFDSFDEEAATAANEAFVFGENDMIDLYSVLGDDYANLAKVDVTFTWTANVGWCGGAGIGNGATLEDGTDWISGPEYGCANANDSLAPDGKATQTVIDITATPLATIANVDKDGNTTFGALYLQNWWNGVEAGAAIEKISFLDADGNEIAVLDYADAADEVVVDEAPATGDTDAATDASKGNADTGVEGVAVVAGLAVLAAAGIVVAKKRK